MKLNIFLLINIIILIINLNNNGGGVLAKDVKSGRFKGLCIIQREDQCINVCKEQGYKNGGYCWYWTFTCWCKN
ncbi:Knot1 domain-containing protein [Meloidogyne graminicola]|uniref:Knot1 domain-containing protein n=1 Tax=Meloidogyne graminicola TaxID=189291 RepID=A0A8S9ZSQ0_9BILA|nr:Knot1 domain-containing protein [Meloidogyne graminicola]